MSEIPQNPQPGAESTPLSMEEGFAFPNPDDLLRNPAELFRVVNSPMGLVAQAEQAGHAVDDQLIHESRKFSESVVRSIFGPEAIAKLTERVKQTTAEEVRGSMFSVKGHLNATDESDATINRVMSELDGGNSELQYHLMNIENAFSNSLEQPDPQFLMDSATKVFDFAETVQAGFRNMTQASEDVETAVRGSAYQMRGAEETAGLGHNKAANNKTIIEDDPNEARIDGMEDSILNRGANSVDEHKQACEQDTSRSMEAIDNMRTDSATIAEDLTQLSASLPVARALSEFRGTGNFSEAADQLRMSMYSLDSISPARMLDLLGEVRQGLGTITSSLESIGSAHSVQRQKIASIIEVIDRSLSSDYLQAA